MGENGLSRSWNGLVLLASLFLFAGCTTHALTRTPPENNREVRLRAVVVDGGQAVSREQIVRLTGLREGARYTPAQLQAVVDSLEVRLDHLSSHPLATIRSSSIHYSTSGTTAELHLSIDPGSAMVVDTITISGPGRSDAPLLLPLLRSRPGSTFNPDHWEADLARVARHYEENGHPFIRVITRPLVPEFREQEIGIGLGMEVTPGFAVQIDRLRFVGNQRSSISLLESTMRARPGQMYDARRVEGMRRRLLRTGWFADVSPGELYRDHDGRYALLFNLREQNSSSITGALGYAPDSDRGGEIAGDVQAHLGNIFGTGRSFDFSWRRDRPGLTSFAIGYREPWIAGSPISAELTLAQETVDSQYVSFEAGLGATAHVGDGWSLDLRISRRGVSADSLSSTPDSLNYSLFGLAAGVALDRRDRVENPSSGGLYRAGSERFWPLSSNADGVGELLRTSIHMEQTIPLRGEWVGFIGLHAVEVRAQTGHTLPLSEWSRLGGATTLRGFPERSLLASRAGWTNLEARYLIGPRSRLFALLDAGVLQADKTHRYDTSYGFGMQLDTGVGLLNLAVALPTGEGWSAAVLHLRVAATF